MIKKYSKKDWKKILALGKDDKYFDSYKIFYKESHYIPFVYVENKKIIGTIVVSRSLDNLHVNYLFMRPDSRGKGLGKQLIDYIEKYAKKNKYAGVRIDVGITNKRAIKFYKREGYLLKGRVKNYYFESGEQLFFWKKM